MEDGRIRTLQAGPAGETVVTIFGQSFGFGDGANALAARFGSVNNFAVWRAPGSTTASIIIRDGRERRFREFKVGGIINTIAGNGSEGALKYNATEAAMQPTPNLYGGSVFDDFATDPQSGNIYLANYVSSFALLTRSTNLWTSLGGDAKTWSPWNVFQDLSISQLNIYSGTNDAFKGSDGKNNLLGVMPRPLAWSPMGIMTSMGAFNGTKFAGEAAYRDTLLGVLDFGAGVRHPVAGAVSAQAAMTVPAVCAVDAPLNGCTETSQYSGFIRTQFKNTNNGGTWLIGHASSREIRSYSLASGSKAVLMTSTDPANSGRGIQAFAWRPAAVSTDPGFIYYCSDNGRIYKRDVKAGTEIKLKIGSDSARCGGKTMYWDSASSNLIFLYSVDGLPALASLLDP